MFGDLEELFDQLNLLHAYGIRPAVPSPAPSPGSSWTFGDDRFVRAGKAASHMARMIGLAAATTLLAFAAGRWRRRRLDDVARRRLGRG